MSNTPKIDEILTVLLVDYGNGDDNVGKAKDQLYQLILEVIGTNDRDYSKDNADEESLKILVATSTACNELRQEQRQKLLELFGKENK